MKKMKFLMVALGIIFMASCVKAGEKAKGNYSGNYTVGSQYTGSANVATATDETVNINLICSALSVNSNANGVTVALSGDNVTFTYSSSTTTAGQMISISGTLTGSSLTFTWTMSLGGSNTVSGSFTGTK